MFEKLDARMLLSSVLTSGTLTITGTTVADTEKVTIATTNVKVSEKGVADKLFPTASVKLISIIGLDGNDVITVDPSVLIPTTIDGGTGNDTITGGGGKDSISGMDGNDSIVGGANSDLLNGNKDNDTILGGEGNDLIFGGTGNDSLKGENGNDALTGNDGDDRLDPGLGNDTVDGSAGGNTLDYATRTTALTGSVNFVIPRLGSAILPVWTGTLGSTGEADTLQNIRNLNLGTSNDAITFNITQENSHQMGTFAYAPMYVYGFSGDDKFSVVGYADTENQYSAGNFPIYALGGAGNDTFNGQSKSETHFYGEEGDDTFNFTTAGLPTGTSVASFYSIEGGDGTDTQNQGHGGAVTVGYNIENCNSLANPATESTSVDNTYYYQSTTITVSGKSVSVNTSGAGDLVIHKSTSTSFNVVGGDGDDSLELAADDQVYSFDGNGGSDEIDFSHNTKGLILNLHPGLDTYQSQYYNYNTQKYEYRTTASYNLTGEANLVGGTTKSTFKDTEIVYGTGLVDNVTWNSGLTAADQTVWNNAYYRDSDTSGLSYVVFGLAGNDVFQARSTDVNNTTPAELAIPVSLYGGDGNDRFLAYGNTTALLYGDAGNDIFSDNATYTASTYNVTSLNVVNGGDGIDTINRDTGYDTALAETFTMPADIENLNWAKLTPANVTINGNALANTISVGAANVTSLKINGNAGNDILTLTKNTSTKWSSVVIHGNDGNDTITGSSDIEAIFGDNHNDSIKAGSGNDYIDGGAGNDTLYGEAGNDSMQVGSGINYADGGDGNDKILARNSAKDSLYGGLGTDSVQADAAEAILNSIETKLA